MSAKAIESARGNLIAGKGVGEELIKTFLHDVPGISTYVIREQIATLKSSGHYERLITQIASEISLRIGNDAGFGSRS